MLGFVVATTKKVAEKLKPTTLEEELAARGIAAIPLEKVRLFQRTHLEAECRAGYTGPYARWECLSVENYTLQFGAIPPDVISTAKRAKTVPGSHVFLERFEADPFVFIQRPKRFPGITIEVCCIAYWNTPNFRP
jgi:hypothetical protein